MWYAALIGAIVSISTVGPTVLASPPFLWGKNAGLINVGGIIGTALGGVYTYFVADWTTKWQARRDIHGYNEPEVRLKLALPGLFLAATGQWTYGFSVEYVDSTSGWGGMMVGMGMVAFGLMQAPSIGFNYVSSPDAKVYRRC